MTFWFCQYVSVKHNKLTLELNLLVHEIFVVFSTVFSKKYRKEHSSIYCKVISHMFVFHYSFFLSKNWRCYMIYQIIQIYHSTILFAVLYVFSSNNDRRNSTFTYGKWEIKQKKSFLYQSCILYLLNYFKDPYFQEKKTSELKIANRQTFLEIKKSKNPKW